MTINFANKAVENIKASLEGRSPSQKPSGDNRYDRMSRKDFSRKANSYAPVLINDGYSNFRFSKRAGEVLSPLSKSKFGFSTMSKRKMSLLTNTQGLNSEQQSGRNGAPFGSLSKMNQTMGVGFSKHSRHKSLAEGSLTTSQ